MNKKIFLIIAVVLAVIVLAVYSGYDSKQKEIDRLNLELAHARIYEPVQHDTIRDTIEVATANVSTVTGSAYKKELADKQLLKDLNVSAGQVMSQDTKGISTHDTVKLVSDSSHFDSFSLFSYADRWVSFHLSLRDTTLDYTVRDSLQTFVIRKYKHKFLWWKWGTKGYEVKVVSFNPHSTIEYNSYIQIDK